MLDSEILLRLVISALLGLTIGLERQFRRKPLGLKTCLVISIVSCLLTIVSIQSAYTFSNSNYIMIRMDPLRLAAQIVSGVGFLGAGVILKRDDNTISGLTTAAIVWGAAGIGIAVGAGFYVEAIAVVLLLFISLDLIPLLVKRLNIRHLNSKEIILKIYSQEKGNTLDIINKIELEVIKISKVHIKELKKNSNLILLNVVVSEKLKIAEVYNRISKIDYITKLEVSE